LEEILPVVAAELKLRETLVTDFDSCVRRLGGVKEKHEKAVELQTATPSVRNAKKVEEAVLEVAKFQGKADIARFMYTEQNDKAIYAIKKARRKINAMVDTQLIAAITTQVCIGLLWFNEPQSLKVCVCRRNILRGAARILMPLLLNSLLIELQKCANARSG
jgi:hypothetical protein